MKTFFLHVIEGVVALCAFFIIIPLCLLLVTAISSLFSSDPSDLSSDSTLRICLDISLEERNAQDDPFALLTGGSLENETNGLDVILDAIGEAKTNDKVNGIFLDGGLLSADFASLQELRAALLDFKTSGKFIACYAEQMTQGGYYIASVADTIMLNPEGMIDWHGIASQPMFYTDLLHKLGVKMQVFKVGTYKSAVEPFILTGMSEANRRQVSSFVEDIWTTIVDDVAEARPRLQADSLRSYASRYVALAKADEYVRLGMVDTLVYDDGAREWLRNHTEKKKRVTFASVGQVAAKKEKASKSDGHIAVYYAYGDIVDSGSNSLTGSGSEIVGHNVVDDLDALRADDDVKAVVLRINSGGGSAYASEQMWRAIQLLKEEKPVVVSMGGMAASGGYYMSCGADYIVADATTLTGSIGIFGMIPDASELLTDKLGLHFDMVKTNEGADMGAMGRPLNEAECMVMQRYVEKGYDLFTGRVAAGRGMTQAAVDEIGQGRVWTGRQALHIGLVDTLGTLNVAIEKARSLALARDEKAEIEGVVAYPAPASFIDRLMSSGTADNYMERKVREALGDHYATLRALRSFQKQSWLQARIEFDVNMK